MRQIVHRRGSSTRLIFDRAVVANQRGTVSLAVIDSAPRHPPRRCLMLVLLSRALLHYCIARTWIEHEERRGNNNVLPKAVFQGCDEYMHPS
jgi:hypothetical protein